MGTDFLGQQLFPNKMTVNICVFSPLLNTGLEAMGREA